MNFGLLLPLAFLASASIATSFDILALFPLPARSHYASAELLLVELARRGHNLTVYTPFPKKTIDNVSNYREIDVSKCFPLDENHLTVQNRQIAASDLFKAIFFFYHLGPTYELMSQCEPLMNLLYRPDKKYDLLLTESFHSDILLIYAHKFKIPFARLTPNTMFPWLSDRLGNPDNPSYIPHLISGYFSNMDFFQRIRNTYAYLLSHVMYRYFINVKENAIARRLLGPDVPPLEDLAKNTSLLFSYAHHTINYIHPLVPAIVQIGGIHIASTAKPLPKDIEKFINGSEHGVIYFCMGSALRGSSFPEDKRNAFLYAFSKIPQRVLWKWERDNLPGKPDNVMIAKWMPQRDILAHPNVKLFISHGGLLGTNEAVYEGVPILGIPIFGDQRANVKSIEASGAGEMLDYNDISDEMVLGKIQKLLHDPKYRENAKELSRRYRDRPMSPLDTAVYWTEYVIRHKGAHHLRSAAVDLPWYQYLLLDVIAFVLLVLVVSLLSVYYSIKYTLRFIFRKLFGKKQPTKSEKSKNKLN